MPHFTPWQHIGKLVVATATAALICAGLIVALMPLLRRYALARPNARSSHITPTPQGGGLAVIASTILVSSIIATLAPEYFIGTTWSLALLFLAATGLAAIGCIDDIWTIKVLPRLIAQLVTVATVVVALPRDLDIIPLLPAELENICVIFIGVWFVNLVNFMDGIDWITVIETSTIAFGIILIGCVALLPPDTIVIALALLGAILGFAPFNRPVARLFLGDVGSLPIGLVLFWLLLQLISAGYLAAAILLPLYYLADSTITLLRRAFNREPVWQAHRTHFYQQATNHGFSVLEILLRVATTNLVLIALALVSVAMRTTAVDLTVLAIGGGAVALLLRVFARSHG